MLRFAALWRAGLVDGLYFAVPTRAAAKQLHGRICQALDRLFPAAASVQTVLAVPGYLVAGDAHGQRVEKFEVFWEDNPDEETRLARWSAESARKFLSAPAAVGTVDQVLLAGPPILATRSGNKLLSLRIPFLVLFLAWVPALYYISSRSVTPVAAGATVLLAVAWSVPNYTAPMPSWYNLFFAVFGAAALLRYLETHDRSWLVATGVCAGLSCLSKIVGLYLVAAVFFFLAFREQFISQDVQGESAPTPAHVAPGSYTWFALGCLLIFLTMVVGLVIDELGAREFVHFVLPCLLLTLLFVWRERRCQARPNGERFATLARLLGPFVLGLSVPVAVFLVPYFLTGSLPAFGHGVFVQSLTQLTFGHARPPSLLATTVAVIPVVVALGIALLRIRVGWLAISEGIVVLGSVLIASASQAFVYRLVWYSIRALVPLVTAAGVALMMWPAVQTTLSDLRQQQILVLLSLMVMVNMVQFPFSTPIYFLYVAPVISLTVVAIMSAAQTASLVPASLLGFYLLFAVLWVNGADVYRMGFIHRPGHTTERLDLDRGQLRITRAEKKEYEQLVKLLRDHARGEFAYATPDCPEVYFLSGLRNPTRTFFDYYDDPTERTARILDAINERDVRVRAEPGAELFGRGSTRPCRRAYGDLPTLYGRRPLRCQVERLEPVS